ncbi:MAG: MCE family protein [Candidatus Omnitrophica bacterium]|nr:MCE family protein [Candidatus Omnitrophota bacterium]
MVFGKTKLELKVGVFVIVGLAILVTFILSIGKFKTWTAGYKVGFIFNFSNGVKVGAPVRFAGMDVGEVKHISISMPKETGENAKVKVLCWVKKKVAIPVDSTIWVNTLGLLGEKYIEIMPGHDYQHCLVANQTLEGVDPLAMHEVVRTAKNIVDNLDQGIERINKGEGTIGKLLYDDSVYNELDAFMKDIRKNPWKLFFRAKEKK